MSKSNRQENVLKIEVGGTINYPISIIMKESENEHVLFSSKEIEKGEYEFNMAKNHGEFIFF